MAQKVAGALYESITGQLFEIGRQLRQKKGYPFNADYLQQHLQAAIDDGLAWLVDQQDASGGWDAFYGAWEAGTGLALYKLCERAYELGYESPFDPDYEYVDNVIAGSFLPICP